MTTLFPQLLSALAWVVYGSFFEWYWHKYWMHVPRTPKEAFRGHTIVHHGLYKGNESYFVPEGQHPEHILLKPYALPGIVIAHLPVMLLIQHFIPHTFIGAFIATVGYFVVYEYMHWNMHVPRKQFVERFRWFQFLRRHHHLHHRHFMKNFCVLFPLADYCFGTLITDESIARRKAEREEAIANGDIRQERTKLERFAGGGGRVRLKRSASSRQTRTTSSGSEAESFAPRRARESRRDRQIREVRAMLETVKPRDDR